jgi:hypothetical protein
MHINIEEDAVKAIFAQQGSKCTCAHVYIYNIYVYIHTIQYKTQLLSRCIAHVHTSSHMHVNRITHKNIKKLIKSYTPIYYKALQASHKPD